ncbi:MAG: hypothetical protein A3B91_03240 [Candidatus Yanofskybacteria bacterium RIFCSPHIGHO2_02_FULL_41_29]|uniref:N-formylglutamate amidohydrolase n=1 Tax=Candidatus Yanofskybacteria bacterium RIFCSPHIGHO2_01_FULL_41_53 TaxID=1802663 RepID=A0A1F8EGN3_9BACT|nr:MAG: hypothetical protein A2650_01065 [Candidatus Yanofskybacteria bacterium RIFCSPHIGHO2_01_FULL_41_53]OGN10678.1 MAG: hypothetical protein A3B91_03240 [Candidatus Yanofskybacteria bacterium RIFCSPHIGHO2_02_FULL_41_29]OGN18126.1 MAG: hypothetical protein A3F48_02255 [Candidatus Yanofskybacteria bacterium RIFCSPHIGHO2_12_FULL_41_9]OGN24064.1 MAG: hypothetical protein A2916_04890 [Candidatus Yanofskybacteria bacterium RIFCSPLOWO2_01_FULL_41_67]OGN30477.1 MAG: hypothetical protein A3H54_00410 
MKIQEAKMAGRSFNNAYIYDSDGRKPVFLEIPHSGLCGLSTLDNVPLAIGNKIRYDSRAVKGTVNSGHDQAVPLMSACLDLASRYRLPLIFNNLARVFCDTNRSKDQVSDWALEGGVPNEHHHRVIWARTMLSGVDLSLPMEELEAIVKERCEKTLSEPLNESQFDSLMKQVYDPYHTGIQFHHHASIKRHGFCIHLALHSLPPSSVRKVLGGYVTGVKASRGSFDLAKNTLPDIILIHNNYKAADKILIKLVRNAFESGGLIVEDGQGPFLDDIGITKIYGNPRRSVNVIGIEHVTHDIELDRHLGGTRLNKGKAKEMQKYYEQAIINLLEE